MLKNKFKIIALTLIILLSIIVPISNAENETQVINQDPESNASPVNTAQNDDSFKKSDVYLSGDDLTIDYIVDGNLFVCANSVTINSQIGGDAFIIANSITVGEEGYIYSNLFAVSKNINIKGVVYDVYATTNTVDISGYVYRDIKLACSDLNISGVVGRNAFVNCNIINFTQANSNNSENTENADNTENTQNTENTENTENSKSADNSEEVANSKGTINGNLTYSSTNNISVPEGSVLGETNFTKIDKADNNSFNIGRIMKNIAAAILSTIIIWLLCIWLAPKFITKSQKLVTKKTLPVIGLGLLTPIVLVIASIILIILNVTLSMGLLSILLLISLLTISNSAFVIPVSYLICEKANMNTKIKQFSMVVIISAVLALLKLIPYIGDLIGFIASVIGLGLIISSILIKNPDAEKEETKKEDNK